MLKKVGTKGVLSCDASGIEEADKLILPGIGAFDEGMARLEKLKVIPMLEQKVVQNKTPILGICLGMQLMTNGSEEGNRSGLGWIDAQTSAFRFRGSGRNLRVPHMGWNSVQTVKDSPLFEELEADSRFYFVHSYYVQCNNTQDVLTVTSYGIEFASSISKDNIFGVQFHPEKSHRFGMKLLKNFLEC
jgi:glutamine amidotransferase